MSGNKVFILGLRAAVNSGIFPSVDNNYDKTHALFPTCNIIAGLAGWDDFHSHKQLHFFPEETW